MAQRRGTNPHRLRGALRPVLEPVVTAAGYDLEELAVSRAGSRFVVRVTVDSDQGVGSGSIGELSRRISTALDEAEAAGGDIIPGEYVLEVSSPGVDRPLTLPRHWRRSRGRLVKVKIGDRMVTGRVTAAGPDLVELDVSGQPVTAGYREFGPGRVQVEFHRLAELGGDDDLDDDDLDDDDLDEDDLDEDDLDEDALTAAGDELAGELSDEAGGDGTADRDGDDDEAGINGEPEERP